MGGWPAGGIDVWEIDVNAHYSGPIKDNYGNGNY